MTGRQSSFSRSQPQPSLPESRSQSQRSSESNRKKRQDPVEKFRKRVRLIVTIDAEGDETEEINTVFQLLRTNYARRNLTVGGVRETKDSLPRRMR